MGWQNIFAVVLQAGNTIIDNFGAKIYNGPPGPNELLASIADQSIDSISGTEVLTGVWVYKTPNNGTAIGLAISGTEYMLAFESSPGVFGPIVLYDSSTGNVTYGSSFNTILEFPSNGSLQITRNTGGTSQLNVDGSNNLVNQNGYFTVPNPVTPSVSESWHSVNLATVTIGGGGGTPTGRLRYRLRENNKVEIDCNISFTATTALASTNLFTLPSQYFPANGINWPIRLFVTPASNVNSSLTGGVTTAGVVFANNVPVGTSIIAFDQEYPLD